MPLVEAIGCFSNGPKCGTNNGRHENGVGFMINEKILHNTKSFTPVNDRICYIKISGRHFDLILINCYAPTKDKADDIKEKFYDELETVMNSLPTHSLKMIVGDFNAKIGRENIYRPIIGPNSLHEISNDNGTKLIHFASSQELTISSTYFPRKYIHKYTWVSPNGRVHNQIDHIMINKRHASFIRK
ncbi:craniofacial development protein 2-like, partial [Sipha flava]|uniref:Craniofacial development protein 2-like n=1 Tax=Sipha flava TaxID=143950 RepID=A0A8B8F412_9HEMI